jgi:AsmA protein
MRKIVRIVGILLALLFVVLISLPFLVSANQFKPMLESSLTKALGRQVTVGNLTLSILSGGVAADDLAIADDPAFSRGPFVQAKSLKLAVELWPLIFSRKLNVTGLLIDQPQVALIQSAAGDWNFSTLGGQTAHAGAAPAVVPAPVAAPPATPAPAGKGSLDLSVQLVRITKGRFSMGKTIGHDKPLALEDVDIQVRDFSSASSFPFSFSAKVAGGGGIKLEGKAGPINSGDVTMTPLSLTLDVAGLDLAATPLAAQAPGLAGLISFHGSGNSAGGRLTIDAKLSVERLKLAKNGTPARRTLEFDFARAHDLRKQGGALQRGNLHIGAAQASLTGTYAEHGDSTTLSMKFSGPKMPVPELAELLPPMGIALPNGSSLQGGTATAGFTAEGPVDRLVTSGSLGLNNTRLAGFDLGKKMSLIESLAGINGGPNTDIEALTADVRMAPEGIAVQNIHFLAPAIGELTGGGTISPANALDFKMRATVHTSGAAAILSKTAVPFFIQGTAQDPAFKPDVKSLAAETAKQNAGKAATGLLNNLLGRKKKPQ